MSSIVVASWDVDGQASASMLIRSGYVETVYYPPVGMYKLSDDEVDILSGYDYIYIVDMHLTRRDVERLSTSSYVYIIDDSPIHPNYNGLDVSCTCYKSYSTTYILMESMGVEPDIDALLGMYNDSGDKVINSEYWDIFWNYLDSVDMGLDDMKRIVRLMNIPMYLGDQEGLYRNTDALVNRLEGLNLDKYADMEELLESYIGELVNDSIDVDGIRLLRYSGRYYVIGEVVKRLFRDGITTAVAIDQGFLPSYTMVAVASRGSLSRLLLKLIEMDLPAGGEEHFLGVLVDKGIEARILKIMSEYIGVKLDEY